MKIDELTIREVIEKIGDNNKIMLPSIQRKYVWKEEDIIKFIDSILLGYPIGIFLFWKINPSKLKYQYQFYSFLMYINRKTNEVNPKIEHLNKNYDYYYSVLDGQQRLTSLLISLDGYIYSKKKYLEDKPENYEKLYLYINLLSDPNKKEDDLEIYYDMAFLSKEAISKYNNVENDVDKKYYWYKLGDVLNLKDEDEIYELKDKVVNEGDYNKEEQKLIERNIHKIYEKFCKENLIKFSAIIEDDLDKVTDIFIRVNNGGKKLEKTDLLYSTIVNNWEDARDNVDNLLSSINGHYFNFDNDFIMRSSMYLTDSPIEMKLSNFTNENIDKIKNSWKNIEQAFYSTISLLENLGYNRDNLVTNNAVMPIIYYIYKGGSINNKKDRKAIKLEFSKYMAVAQLNRVFGASSNTILNTIRNALRELKDGEFVLKNREFKLKKLQDAIGDKFNIGEKTIDDWIATTEKGAYAFALLSLIKAGFNPKNTKYHQDHMHPESALRKWPKFKDNRNKVGNIQLLPNSDNQEKSQESLIDWLKDEDNRKNAQLLPKNISYEIKDFDNFLEKRNELIKKELLKKFDIKPQKD